MAKRTSSSPPSNAASAAVVLALQGGQQRQPQRPQVVDEEDPDFANGNAALTTSSSTSSPAAAAAAAANSAKEEDGASAAAAATAAAVPPPVRRHVLHFTPESLIRLESAMQMHFSSFSSSSSSFSAVRAGAAVSSSPLEATADADNDAAASDRQNFRRSTTATSGRKVSFDDFYALRGKVTDLERRRRQRADDDDAVGPIESANQEGDCNNDVIASERGLSDSELLLYDYLMVTVPSLNRIFRQQRLLLSPAENDDAVGETRQVQKEEAQEGGSGDSTVPGCAVAVSRYCIEMAAASRSGGSSNRTHELRKLLARQWNGGSQAVPERTREDVLAAIRSHRAASAAAAEKSSNGRRKRSRDAEGGRSSSRETKAETAYADDDSGSAIVPGMTIDERVQARARAKRRYDEQEAAESNNAGNGGGTAAIDRNWLIRLADALWIYSTSIVKTQQKLSPRRHENALGPCIVTVQDLLAHLCRSLATTAGSRTSVHAAAAASKGEKTSKREIANSVLQMQELVPDFVSLKDRASKGTAVFTKDATLWIFPEHYHAARRELSGQPPLDDKTRLSDPDFSKPKKCKRIFDRMTPSTTASEVSVPRVLFETPLDRSATQLAVATVTDQNNVDASKNQRAASTMEEVAKFPQKQSDNNSTLAADRPRGGTKRPADPTEDDPGTPSEGNALSPVRKKKRRSPLRINPHLILSDADRGK